MLLQLLQAHPSPVCHDYILPVRPYAICYVTFGKLQLEIWNSMSNGYYVTMSLVCHLGLVTLGSLAWTEVCVIVLQPAAAGRIAWVYTCTVGVLCTVCTVQL